jgi:peptidase M28-like protein/PDZ domain-containing protein
MLDFAHTDRDALGRSLKQLVFFVVLAFAILSGLSNGRDDTADNRKAEAAAVAERRINESAHYIASDELEGRGLGTKGLNMAADYLAAQFREIGLKTDSCDGTPFQTFKVTISSKLGPRENNRLSFVAPNKESDAGSSGDTPRNNSDLNARELKLGTDFTPLAVGGSATFDLPIVFAGYGITSSEDQYDDFEGVDVTGKAVIILRHEPQQTNPHGAFEGTKDSRHAPIARKISNAYQHGAEAVLLVTDEVEIEKRVTEAAKRYQQSLDAIAKANDEFKQIEKPTLDQIESHRKKIDILLEQARAASERVAVEYDPLFPFDRGSDPTDNRRFAVIHCRRGAVEPLIKVALGKTLAELERAIDEGPKPCSRELTGWRVRGRTDIERVEVAVKNVVAVLEGSGPHADETVVVGAHYDHLGRGEPGTLALGSKEIHNGADDNGSGTVALLEVARQLAGRDTKLPRRIVFIAFTGEERGLLGSGYYVHHPLFPLEKTIAMLNMDMVGRLKDNELIVYGTGTAKQFDGLIDELNKQHGFKIKRDPGGFGPSDHSSFYAQKIPVLHFFTGLHSDYHRPSDDADKLNFPGIRQVSEMVAEAAEAIASAEEPPTYQQAGHGNLSSGDQPAGDRPYFGSIPNLAGGEQEGYAIQGVGKGSPAEKAGLQSDDVIIRFGENKIGNLADFDSALRKFKAADKVPVVVRRNGKEVKLEVVLEPPR